jgi:cobalt-zinc-cadmium efflux system protein
MGIRNLPNCNACDLIMETHSHIYKHEVKEKNLGLSVILNLTITIAQVIGGFLSGSLALLSDALHNFSDVLTLVFSWIAHRLAHKKATPQATFGYKRAELIAAFVNAATLIIVAIFLIYGSIHRFFHSEKVTSETVIWLALLGIAVNGISAFALQKDAAHNLNMKSAYLHLFTDMMASVAVLTGGLLMKFFSWFWVDSVLSFGISIYLIVVGGKLLLESTQMLMLFTPKSINIKALTADIEALSGIKSIHHIHVWSLNDYEHHLEAHIDCSHDISVRDFNGILDHIEQLLLDKYNINHCTIQPEFRRHDSKETIVQD